jgi:hypothetical protein
MVAICTLNTCYTPDEEAIREAVRRELEAYKVTPIQTVEPVEPIEKESTPK